MINVLVSVPRIFLNFLRKKLWLPKHSDAFEDKFNSTSMARVTSTRIGFYEYYFANFSVDCN